MKIAMIHVDLPNESKGGVAFQAHYLANALVDRGHDVTMFTFSPVYEECLYKVHQYAIAPKLRKFQSFLFAYHLGRTDFSGFDIIHSHGDNYLMGAKHPQIRTFHGSARDEAAFATSLKRRIYQSLTVYLEEAGARVADINIGVSEATKSRIPAIAQIIPCGFDRDRFYAGQKSAHPTILFVGTLEGRKRGGWLAEIFNREIRTVIPTAELWSVSDRPLEGEGIVNFGRVPLEQLCELFRTTWVFCLPSTYEGFGVPYIEAMASGTSVVASPNLGAKEVLGNGKFGIIAEDNQLGNSLLRLLMDTELRDHYVKQGTLRSHDFTWSRIVEQYEKIYESLYESTAKVNEVI